MKKAFFVCLLMLCSQANSAWADSEVMHVYFLPLNEAAEVVKSQLSTTGRVSALPSRRILIVEDDKKHIQQAKDLLKQLDAPVNQYTVEVAFNMLQKKQQDQITTSAQLPGGWIKLSSSSNSLQTRDKQRFQLAVSANQRASIETGELRSYRKNTRTWLTSHGLIKHNSVDIIPITSGFYVSVWKADNDKVRIRLLPWMRRTVPNMNMQNNAGAYVNLNSKAHRKEAHEAPLLLQVSPNTTANPVVKITSASTELTIPIGKTITIAATDQQAQQLGTALLSRYSMSSSQYLVMKLTVQQH